MSSAARDPGSGTKRRVPATVLALVIGGVAVLGALAVERAIRASTGAAAGTPRVVSYDTRTMGTYATVSIVTADSAASAADAHAAQLVFERVDSLMSNWTETSEVARLNREAAARPVAVDPEVAAVIEAALHVGGESGGAFDITVEPLVRAWGFIGGRPHVPSAPEARAAFARVGADQLAFDPRAHTLHFTSDGMAIDLGGIAKGHAVDGAAAALRARGVSAALVDIAGNMIAFGAPRQDDAWRIGIRDPRDRMPYFARLRLVNQAVATSGKYEQFVAQDGKTYGHILDPRTGKPADGLISVTVVAASAMQADAWGTALFVLGGAPARRLLAGRNDLAAILVSPATSGPDTVWVSKRLADSFTLVEDAHELFRVESYD